MKAILLNRILWVLSLVGLFIAGVLSMEAGLGLEVPCGPSGGCARVAMDPSSKWFGVPVAYFGLGGYLLLAVLAGMRLLRPVRDWKKFVGLGYIVAAVGTLISLYLQYQSFFQIHATCLWCLSSAITMIVTLIVYAMLAQELERTPDQGLDQSDGPSKVMFGVLPAALFVGLLAMGISMKSVGVHVGADLQNISVAELVPAGAHVFGKEDAPLTIVEFADLCCPACQRTSPKVKEFAMENPGKLRIVYRHYPLSKLHPEALSAAAISEIASDDNRFWEFAMAVMALQRQPNDIEELISIAHASGVDENKLRERLSNKNDEAYARVARDLQLVQKLGITSTPTFLTVVKGKVVDVFGPSQIIDQLESPKYKRIMNGNAE